MKPWNDETLKRFETIETTHHSPLTPPAPIRENSCNSWTTHFLGYRNDLDRLLPLCDIAVASSLREGLPVNVMEAMACGLPVIAVQNRGHSELVGEPDGRFRVSGFQGFSRGKAAGFRVSGLQGCKVAGEQGNSVKQYETSETSETLKRLETNETRPGFIVQPNNPYAMATHLHLLATDPVLRQVMGMAGRQRVVGNYALPVVTKQLTELYVRTLTGCAK